MIIKKFIVYLKIKIACWMCYNTFDFRIGFKILFLFFLPLTKSKYKKIFEENKVEVFSSNFKLYGDMSNRVMSIISRFIPDVEIYSIDEAFLKFDGFSEDTIDQKCREIIETVSSANPVCPIDSLAIFATSLTN